MLDLGFSQRVDKDSSLYGQILAEDGSSKLLRNVRSYLPINMASGTRRSKRIPKILTACTQMFQNERTFLFLFVRSLFNDAVNSFYCITPTDTLSSKQ